MQNFLIYSFKAAKAFQSKLFLTGIALLFCVCLKAQENGKLTPKDSIPVIKDAAVDTNSVVKKKKTKNPKIASLLSAVVPSAGQIYNGSYWKAPVIYALAGGLIYIYNQNNTEYKHYKSALFAKADGDPSTTDIYPNYPESTLLSLTEEYQRQKDFAIAGMVVLYALNIVDAAVDAHLYSFDVSDDLSMNLKLKPLHIQTSLAQINTAGLTLSLKFNK